MERLAAWDENSVKLIQQNHPDVGWLFYDKDGNQQADGGYERSFGLINVMEIHPIDKLLKRDRFDIRGGKPIENHTGAQLAAAAESGFPHLWRGEYGFALQLSRFGRAADLAEIFHG